MELGAVNIVRGPSRTRPNRFTRSQRRRHEIPSGLEILNTRTVSQEGHLTKRRLPRLKEGALFLSPPRTRPKNSTIAAFEPRPSFILPQAPQILHHGGERNINDIGADTPAFPAILLAVINSRADPSSKQEARPMVQGLARQGRSGVSATAMFGLRDIHPGGRLDEGIEAASGCPLALGPKGRQIRNNNPRVHRPELFGVQPARRETARPIPLQHDVGVARELENPGLVVGDVEIEGDAALAARELAVESRQVREPGTCDPEDVGAVGGEGFPRDGGRDDAAELEDAEAGETPRSLPVGAGLRGRGSGKRDVDPAYNIHWDIGHSPRVGQGVPLREGPEGIDGQALLFDGYGFQLEALPGARALVDGVAVDASLGQAEESERAPAMMGEVVVDAHVAVGCGMEAAYGAPGIGRRFAGESVQALAVELEDSMPERNRSSRYARARVSAHRVRYGGAKGRERDRALCEVSDLER